MEGLRPDNCPDSPQFENSLRDVMRKIQDIYNLSETIWTMESVPEILQAITDNVAAIVPANRVALISFNLAERTIEHFVRGGPGRDRIDTTVDFTELYRGLSGWVLENGRPALSFKDSEDPRESSEVRQRRQETACGSIIVVPLRHRNANIGTMTAINLPDERDFTPMDMELMALFGNYCAMVIENARIMQELARKNQELEWLSERDSLTGLFNRRIFQSRVNDAWRHCLREQTELALIIILPHTGLAAARAMAETIKSDMAILAIPHAPGIENGLVTLSQGVAAGRPAPGASFDSFLHFADTALYQSKNGGRNQVNCLAVEAEPGSGR